MASSHNMMRSGRAFYGRIILSLFVVLIAAFCSAYAQSGRLGQVSQPTPTPSRRGEQSDQPNLKASLNGNNSVDLYKLVFPVSRDGDRRWKHVDYERALFSLRTSFIEQLNQAGAQGYRLISTTGGYPIAIAKLDEVQYEYAWFDTVSDQFFEKKGFLEKYAELAKQGFRLVENVYGGESCWTESVSNVEICKHRDVYIVQKNRGVGKPVPHLLISSVPGWGAHPDAELSSKISGKLVDGFSPSRILSKFEILLEKFPGNDEMASGEVDVQVVSSSWGLRDDANVEKKVNELGKQGYRLALVSNAIAVMYRRPDTATPVSYVWVNAEKKDLEKQLAQMQSKGAIYRMPYPDRQGNKTKLIFEQSAADNNKRFEFKVLKFKFEEVDDKTANKVQVDMTPASKETMKTLNMLAADGFVVRAMFYSDKVTVLLERSL